MGKVLPKITIWFEKGEHSTYRLDYDREEYGKLPNNVGNGLSKLTAEIDNWMNPSEEDKLNYDVFPEQAQYLEARKALKDRKALFGTGEGKEVKSGE